MFTNLSEHFEFRHLRPHYLDVDTIFGDKGAFRVLSLELILWVEVPTMVEIAIFSNITIWLKFLENKT
jgi:hypothetical protein